MNNIPTPRNRLVAALMGLGLFLAVSLTGHATALYTYSIDTSAYSGQSGYLAFDLFGSDAALGNNSLLVTGLNAGTGSLADSSNFSMTDVNFFNEELRAILFGDILSFKFQISGNFAGGTPDSFGFYLLDDVFLFPLFPTSDPLLTDAVFAVDINGSATGSAGRYAGSLAVPDQGSTLALGGLAFGLLAFARRFGARRTAA